MERVIYNFDTLSAHLPAAPAPAARPQGGRDGRAANPRIGVIYNPRSHRNKGQDLACTARVGITVAQPKAREEIAGALSNFAEQGIDYLIINGGDGTVRDVLTMGQTIFAGDWPALAILPKGKTNALNVDLGAPSGWNLAEAIAAYSDGRRITRRPLLVAHDDMDEPAMLGFIFGAGAFTLGIEAGQEAHQLGFFNSLAVGATGAWGVLQALFGSDTNLWRRGTPMRLAYQPSGEPVAHSGHGDPDRRSFILSSTLEKLPMGIKLFGADHSGLKLTLLDKPRRRILSLLPAILLGWQPKWLGTAGLHQLDAEGFTLDVAEPVILDGEAFPPGRYTISQGPALTFVTP